MNNNYFIVYQTNFDSYSIEITYYTTCKDNPETMNFELDECKLNDLINLLSYFGFEDRTPGDCE